MDLQRYLDSHGIKHRFFAEKIGISTSTLHCLLKKRNLPSLKLAYEIEKETNSLVTLYDWVEKAVEKK